MSFLKKSFFVLCCFLVTVDAMAKPKPATMPQPQDTEVARFFKKFHEFTDVKGAKIWPGLNWKNLKLVVVDRDTSSAWEYDNAKDKIKKLDFEKLPQRAHATFSTRDDRQDPVALYVRWKATNPNSVFDLTVHELFHSEVQENWKIKSPQPSGASRSTTFPVDTSPRIARQMLLLRLHQFYQSGESEKLKQAKFWFEKFKTDFQKDYNAIYSTDRDEGTAFYFEFNASTGPSKLKEDEQNIYQGYGSNMLSADAESYPLGLLAGLILDHKIANWKARAAKGETPLAILFENSDIQSAPDEPDSKITRKVKKYFEPENKKWRPVFKKFRRNRGSKDFIALNLMSGKMEGSFSPEGFYSLTGTAPLNVITNCSATFSGKNGSLAILKKFPVIEYGKNGFLIYVPRSWFKDQTGTITRQDRHVSLTNFNYKITEKDGIERVEFVR